MDSLLGLFAPTSLVLLAGAVQTAAMMFRNQVVMRCILLLGTCLYIYFYINIVSPPLYEAAFISVATGLSTFYGLVLLLLDRSPFMLKSEQKHIYKAIGYMEPGQFRHLLRLCKRHILESEVVLTHEGKKPTSLFFIPSGKVIVEKGATSFELSGPLFIGEISYITGEHASATIRAEVGTEVIEWDTAILQKAAKRKPSLGLALDARLASDLARKVATSVAFSAIHQTALKSKTEN